MQITKILIASMVALTSCATLYQKEGFFTNGYSDMRAGQDIFVVTFRANEFTPAKKVKKYALRRAAEVALKNGYRYFIVLDETGRGKHLHYPSVRMTIQCFHEKPDRPVIDAHSL
ncbi:MAG: hypothetical protein K1X28_01020 [Parachlamydiales bacterium]|nr:hypothetical protein [Parachlamydiales bacterium]